LPHLAVDTVDICDCVQARHEQTVLFRAQRDVDHVIEQKSSAVPALEALFIIEWWHF
jgi:hypothetical protein